MFLLSWQQAPVRMRHTLLHLDQNRLSPTRTVTMTTVPEPSTLLWDTNRLVFYHYVLLLCHWTLFFSPTIGLPLCNMNSWHCSVAVGYEQVGIALLLWYMNSKVWRMFNRSKPVLRSLRKQLNVCLFLFFRTMLFKRRS